jgi:hypothetical protein
MPRANTQAVRISNDLIEALKEPAKAGGRSVPMEIEHRLRRSLEGVDERQLSPWPRSVGRLLALLAEELAAYSEPNKTAAMLRVGAAKLLAHLVPDGEPADESGQAEAFAEYLWLKMMNAHQRTHTEGVASEPTTEQLELQRLRDVLLPPKTKPAPGKKSVR